MKYSTTAALQAHYVEQKKLKVRLQKTKEWIDSTLSDSNATEYDKLLAQAESEWLKWRDQPGSNRDKEMELRRTAARIFKRSGGHCKETVHHSDKTYIDNTMYYRVDEQNYEIFHKK